MDEHKYKRKDPWEPGMYETGRTRPPKSHGGLIAVLLVVVIFLCGLVSALGVVNVKLFAQLNELSKPREDDLSFINEELDSTAPTAQEPAPTAETAPLQQISTGESFVLNPSPESVPNVMQEGGLPLQQIYDKVIPSVVSISATGNSGSSTGTGVILSTEGYIVTNCHVIDGVRQITVLLTDDRSFTANLIIFNGR
jgi:S1-C subfamily serine protease